MHFNIIRRTDDFNNDYKKLSDELKKRFVKQLNFLLSDPWYLSIRVKKIKGFKDIFEGRVSKSCRFTFCMDGDRLTLRRIGDHDKTLKKP